MKLHEARYPLPLSAEEQAHLSPAERVANQRKREAFDREVEQHKAHIRDHGWLDVAPQGGRCRAFNVPVVLKARQR